MRAGWQAAAIFPEWCLTPSINKRRDRPVFRVAEDHRPTSMTQRSDGHYLLLLSIHGLIRGQDLELGRDADTGGQTKYVVDLARAVAAHRRRGAVDLVTRRVDRPRRSATTTPFRSNRCQTRHGSSASTPDPTEYIRKEAAVGSPRQLRGQSGDWLNEQPRMPDLVHSHYADAGYVGVRLANHLGIPLVHTGHSLGRDKRKRLLARGLSQGRHRADLQHRATHRRRGRDAGQCRPGRHQHSQRDRAAVRALQLLRSCTHGRDSAGYRPGAVPPADRTKRYPLRRPGRTDFSPTRKNH